MITRVQIRQHTGDITAGMGDPPLLNLCRRVRAVRPEERPLGKDPRMFPPQDSLVKPAERNQLGR